MSPLIAAAKRGVSVRVILDPNKDVLAPADHRARPRAG
jgi:sugar-specific transcriptional regulator TrmB